MSLSVLLFFCLRIRRQPRSTRTDTLFPYSTLFRSTVAAILLLRRWRPTWPVLVIAVAAASLAGVLLHLPVDTVASRFGALPSGLPAPHWPQVTPARLIEMLPSAFIIAFLAGVESLLSAIVARSEERRVGKMFVSQCRSRWSPVT